MKKLIEKAELILRNNDRGDYTVPSARIYPHQWAWDSAFAAIGWAHIDPERALRELQTLMATQWSDGRIPHIRFDPKTTGYFPESERWGASGTSTITQPPVFAIAARIVHEIGANLKELPELIPALERAHEFFRRSRDPLGWN